MKKEIIIERLIKVLKEKNLKGEVLPNKKDKDDMLEASFVSTEYGEPDLIFKIFGKDPKNDESLHFHISIASQYLELWMIVDNQAILGMIELGKFGSPDELATICEIEYKKHHEELENRKNYIDPTQFKKKGGGDEDDDEMCYEMECPVCGESICDEDGSFDECEHVLLSWNSFDGGPSYIHKDIEPLISDNLDCSDIIEEEFLSKVREKIDADVEPLIAESGLNQCLTSTPTLYAIVKTK
jgi:hypothetical protein